MRKLVLVLLLIFSLSFATWHTYAVAAIFISLGLLAVILMVGIGFDIREMQILAKDEFYQLLILALLMLVLFGTDGILNALASNAAFARGQDTLQDAAVASLNDTLAGLSDYLANDIADADLEIMKQSSQVSACYVIGGGYSVTACGGYSMLSTPLAMAGSLMGYAIAEGAAIKKLILISQEFAFILILPLGIILRTFRFTRGAGGFLIALAISMYILIPGGIVFADMLHEEFEYQVTASDAPAHLSESEIYLEATAGIDVIECDAANPWGGAEEDAVTTYNRMRLELKKYIYIMLVKATIGPVIAILLFISGLRALTALFGAPVDVSILGRFF